MTTAVVPQLDAQAQTLKKWFKDVGTKVQTAKLFEQSKLKGAFENCEQLTSDHTAVAPWLRPEELHELLEIVSKNIDRAPDTEFDLEPLPFMGWRNLASHHLSKAFFYSPAEKTHGAGRPRW